MNPEIRTFPNGTLELTNPRRFHAMASGSTVRVGDKVRLNSGGPEMTVTGFSPRGNAWCEWESESERWKEHSFPPACLTLVMEPQRERREEMP
jgi:uncharacterized protein YodC (DUF2158 family)